MPVRKLPRRVGIKWWEGREQWGGHSADERVNWNNSTGAVNVYRPFSPAAPPQV